MSISNDSIPLYDKPIKLPGSPFWNVFRRFGRDEVIALIINVLGTFIIGLFFVNKIILSLAGPIIEKIGFFPAHFYEAYQVRQTTVKEKRKSLSSYFKKAIKNGSKSLIEDVLIHDPFYILLMFSGLYFYPQTPAWILALSSFIVAVFIVSILEVTATEIRYFLFLSKFKRAGCRVENYYEARFLIKNEKNSKEIMKKISKKFNLSDFNPINYHDIYFETNLPSFSGRKPMLRIRDSSSKPWGSRKSMQVVYIRPSESVLKNPEQYRYFPIKKDKVYYTLDSIPRPFFNLKNKRVSALLKKYSNEHSAKSLKFTRLGARNDQLLVSLDKVDGKKYLVAELKVYSDVNLLIEAMRFMMREFTVIQTTQNKCDI